MCYLISTCCKGDHPHKDWINWENKVKAEKSSQTLCCLVHCAVHGILQARILEWVAIPFARGSSQPRDQTQVSHTPGGFFTIWVTREDQQVAISSRANERQHMFFIYPQNCQHPLDHRKRKTFALLTMPKPLTVWITTNCEKFLKRWEYQYTLPASWEICMQVKKQQLELDMEQQTGSKLGKE